MKNSNVQHTHGTRLAQGYSDHSGQVQGKSDCQLFCCSLAFNGRLMVIGAISGYTTDFSGFKASSMLPLTVRICRYCPLLNLIHAY